MPPFPLSALPAELVIAVLHQLDAPDLLRCTQVCRALHATVSSTPALQYTLLLHVTQLAPCGPSPLPLPARIALLTRHHLAWKHLQPSLRCTIPLDPSPSTLYELYGGTYARGTHSHSLDQHEHPWAEHQHEEAPHRPATTGTFLVDLPSDVSALPPASWARRQQPYPVADFTLDRAQDLWVGIQRTDAAGRPAFTIHLRSLTTNEPHPRAATAALTHPLHFPHPHPHPPSANANLVPPNPPQAEHATTTTHYTMQVCGGMLAVLFQHHAAHGAPGEARREELEVWDWRAGVRVAEITPEEAQEEEAHSFSFLAEDVLLLAKTTYDEGLLDVIQLPATASLPPSPPAPGTRPTARETREHWARHVERGTREHGLDGSGRVHEREWEGEKEAYRIATFRLPKLRRDWMYHSIVSRSDPAPVPEPFATRPTTTPAASASTSTPGSAAEPEPPRMMFARRRRSSSSANESPVRAEVQLTPEPPAAREPLFQPRPEARLFVFTLHLLSITGAQECSLLLFTSLDMLLRPVREHRAQLAGMRHLATIPPSPSLGGARMLPPTTRPPYTVIPWRAWAARTRILLQRTRASHACYVAGWRYVTYDRVPAVLGAHGGACVVRVLDFNPVALRKELLDGRDPLEDAPTGVVRRVVTHPSGDVAAFAEKDRAVETALPYAECVLQAVFPDATGVLLDMERLIVTRRVAGRQVLDVLAF